MRPTSPRAASCRPKTPSADRQRALVSLGTSYPHLRSQEDCQQMFAANAYRIRFATVEDAATLGRLAERYYQQRLLGRILIGEIDGTPAAALSLTTAASSRIPPLT